uniref:Uncharacterized protein n=1 Tax=Arundo donax TaxID=35708 RepID=A0A0A8YIA3_ARUDO
MLILLFEKVCADSCLFPHHLCMQMCCLKNHKVHQATLKSNRNQLLTCLVCPYYLQKHTSWSNWLS